MMESNPDGRNHREELDYLHDRLIALEELNRDYLGMIENSFDAMSIADCDGRLLLVNPAFERIMGIKKTEALSRTVDDLTAHGITDASAASKVLETGKEETVIISTPSGRQVLSTGVPFYDQEGKIIRVYCNIRDITELNHLRQKYEQTQKLASKYLSELLEFKKGKAVHFVAHSKKIQQ
ncbi:MAG: PAS domain-containing protein, partial [Firmicutes bacterium]|nr:PAS domain-containing protein [Bacillota bacterium]